MVGFVLRSFLLLGKEGVRWDLRGEGVWGERCSVGKVCWGRCGVGNVRWGEVWGGEGCGEGGVGWSRWKSENGQKLRECCRTENQSVFDLPLI